jgi:hypothetical protein
MDTVYVVRCVEQDACKTDDIKNLLLFTGIASVNRCIDIPFHFIPFNLRESILAVTFLRLFFPFP